MIWGNSLAKAVIFDLVCMNDVFCIRISYSLWLKPLIQDDDEDIQKDPLGVWGAITIPINKITKFSNYSRQEH
jgi:hypothetical protein